jgi:orotate phosphoribosyltransferase
MQDELLNLLAARQGHFRLESGHHGDLWLALDRLFLRPGSIRPFASELAAKLASYHLAAVCGPLIGGALLAQTIAAELDVEFYYTQRFTPPDAQRNALYSVAYRLPHSLRRIVQGKDVAIVDDVINAGSAVRATWAELRACGARPVVIGALLVLGSAAPGFFAEHNVPLESTATLPSGLWSPAECPLCASGAPLQEVVAN